MIGMMNGYRLVETGLAPFETALDRPLQDTGPFRFQLFGKMLVPFLGWDGDASETRTAENPADQFLSTTLGEPSPKTN